MRGRLGRRDGHRAEQKGTKGTKQVKVKGKEPGKVKGENQGDSAMDVSDVLTNEYVLVVSGVILTGFLSGVVVLARRRWKDAEFLEALETVSRKVGEVHVEYVVAIKKYRADGKLTEAEQAEARNQVFRKLRAVAMDEGLDVIRILSGHVPMWIHQFVQAGKSGSAVTVRLPSGAVETVRGPYTFVRRG